MTLSSSAAKPLVELDGIALNKEPQPAYLEWLASTGAFFDSVEWGNVLQRGLGATRFYLWDAKYLLGHALTCFHRGPLHIGYLGFPVCASAVSDSALYALDRMVAATSIMRGAPQLLRIPTFAFGNRTLSIVAKSSMTVESCITDLPAWHGDSTPVRRRDLNFARKRCASMTLSNHASGASLYDLYASVVTRHHGNHRYTRAYFNAITEMSHNSPLRIFSMNDEKGVAGMVLTVRHGDTGYYLHSGTRPDAMRLGIADLLIERAITDTQDHNAARFNFLPSPQEQAGLIRFKEKWGGISRSAQTLDVPINVVGRILIRLLG